MAGLEGPLLLVGAGRMGGALLEGWRARGLAASEVLVVEPDGSQREHLRQHHGVAAVAEPKMLPTEAAPRALIFAVKPQAMTGVLPAYQALATAGRPVVLSIAAGTAMARFEAAFGARTPVVRAMPNTPAAIGRGATALVANDHVDPAQRALCETLLAAVGQVHWVADEDDLHAVTALSGGGPAYVFLLIETLARAGVALGLDQELARALARATVCGSGALADADEAPVEDLRRNVTSPGGTTEAALGVLTAERGLQPLVDAALAAAAARSRELA